MLRFKTSHFPEEMECCSKMRKGLCSEGDAKILLELFELILDHDKLIDEVGFIHPSQFADLNGDSSASGHPSVSILQTADESLRNSAAEFNSLLYDETVFWYSNHKLAISMLALPILYNAARLAYMDSKSGYKRSISLAKNTGSLKIASCRASCIQFPEIDVLKHSKALLILSPDFGSVWNSRKLVLSSEHDLSLFMDEFNLSTLILSFSSKSEQAWSHRRWVIKKIAGKFHVLHDIIGKESELVKRIVEKSKMNYRAWNHCFWLISYMNKGQKLELAAAALQELKEKPDQEASNQMTKALNILCHCQTNTDPCSTNYEYIVSWINQENGLSCMLLIIVASTIAGD